ncbi:hypothetical protein ACFW9S_11765 [Streptomyces anulatus]|uniref:hypothetical protein n=1 Tax=Streptomyces anulatus TaxID=1892 RepID=UPI0036877693
MAPDDLLDRAVQCHLSAHEGDQHYGLLAELGQYGTALWLRWHGPPEPIPITGQSGSTATSTSDACCLLAGHVERHSWEETPPQ